MQQRCLMGFFLVLEGTPILPKSLDYSTTKKAVCSKPYFFSHKQSMKSFKRSYKKNKMWLSSCTVIHQMEANSRESIESSDSWKCQNDVEDWAVSRYFKCVGKNIWIPASVISYITLRCPQYIIQTKNPILSIHTYTAQLETLNITCFWCRTHCQTTKTPRDT